MEENKCTCPHCQQDISEFVQQLIDLRIKQIKAANARKGISPEQRAKIRKESLERILKWGRENPEKVKANALKASKARTAESFARQRKAVKETIIKKNMKFAELLFEAKNSGVTITPEIEVDLLQKATRLVKEENKAAKKAAKKVEKQKAE
jgi:hypothetical protein